MDASGWVAIGTAIVAILTAIGSIVMNFQSKRGEIKKSEYELEKAKQDDAITQWKDLVTEIAENFEKHRTDSDRQKSELQTELNNQRQLFTQEINKHREMIHQLELSHSECRIQNAELKAEVRFLQDAMRRVQGATGTESPASVLPAQITAGLDGIITQASPAVTPLLHYLAKELIGQNVEVLIPERYKIKHRAGLAALAGAGPHPGAAVSFYVRR
jgi:PAS domain-containing protein